MRWDSAVGDISAQRRVLNAVALKNAVLCAECDVVSDIPHDTCLVCGSHSLFNVARIFGGNLPKKRARLLAQQSVGASPPETVLAFPKPQRPRRRAAISSSPSSLEVNGDGTQSAGITLVARHGD